MKYLFSLVLIAALVGCGDGGSSPNDDAAQPNPQAKSDAKPNTKTGAKPNEKKNDSANSPSDGTDILIGPWIPVIGGPNNPAFTYTFKKGGEGSMTAPGVPSLKFTWKTHGPDKLELIISGREVSINYAVTGDTLTFSPPSEGPQKDSPPMEFRRGDSVASSKHPAVLVHKWTSDPISSNGVTQTMVLGKSGDLVLTPKEGKAAKGKWEVDGNQLKLMFVDPVSGDDRQQEFSLVIGGSEMESDDGTITDKRANLYLTGVGDNKTSILYERPLPAATKTDEATPE